MKNPVVSKPSQRLRSCRRSCVSLSIAFLLSGCASVLNTADHDEFACPGMPAGVICKSPVQIYRATNDRDSVTAEPSKKEEGLAALDSLNDGSGLVSIQTEKAARGKPSTLPLPRHMPIAQSGTPNLPLPILEPAKVMRIWIAPWEDSKKDLHWPSYLFTEIQPRKWSFGKSEFTGSRPVVPHLMVMPSAQPSVPDRSDTGRAGAVQPVSSPQAVTGIPDAALPQPGDALLGAQ
ncbi:MAG: type IV conjugative transfer system lipoprotein TraV [Betaproteobacteria bacterium]|nr:type IV conjugative transfer system lipoprotein TraV [Betaproteobacteria bacterium]